jgi:hypothetical protein
VDYQIGFCYLFWAFSTDLLEDEMNKKQRIILSIGILLVIVNGLFPPYEGELRRQSDNLKNYMGYHFLFTPPTERDVYEAILGRRASNTISHIKLSMFSSHIITSRVWVQVVTVVVATVGLLFLVAGKDNKASSQKPDIGRRTQSQKKGIVIY